MLRLEALLRLLAERCGGNLPLERGCACSLKLSKEEFLEIFGEEDTVGHVAYHCKIRQTPDGDFLFKIKRWQQDWPITGPTVS